MAKVKAKTRDPSKYNNHMPPWDRYFTGVYDNMFELRRNGRSVTHIAARFKVTTERVRQIIKAREKLEKLGKLEREMLKLSPQSASFLNTKFERIGVPKSLVKKLSIEEMVRIPGVGVKMANEIHGWARSPNG